MPKDASTPPLPNSISTCLIQLQGVVLIEKRLQTYSNECLLVCSLPFAIVVNHKHFFPRVFVTAGEALGTQTLERRSQ